MDTAESSAPARTGDDSSGGSTGETSRRLSREQLYVLVSAASMNLGCMMAYSILGPFFPKEAEKKGASNTMIGMIFGCYALFELLASLVFGKYLVQIGAKFMFIAGMFISGGVIILFGYQKYSESNLWAVSTALQQSTCPLPWVKPWAQHSTIIKNVLDQLPDGPIFIVMCFLVRIVDAIGFGAAITASSSILAKAFPNNVATVMGSLEVFSGLGLIAGPPLGGFLYQSFGYEVPFILLGCVVLLMIPLNLCILPSYGSATTQGSKQLS